MCWLLGQDYVACPPLKSLWIGYKKKETVTLKQVHSFKASSWIPSDQSDLTIQASFGVRVLRLSPSEQNCGIAFFKAGGIQKFIDVKKTVEGYSYVGSIQIVFL